MRRKFSESFISLADFNFIACYGQCKIRQPSCDYFTSSNVLVFVNGKHSFGCKSSHHNHAVVSISFFLSAVVLLALYSSTFGETETFALRGFFVGVFVSSARSPRTHCDGELG